MPPLPDPDAQRRNKDGAFRSIFRDENREVPPFPSSLQGSVPPHLHDFIDAYWSEVFYTLGDLLGPIDHFTVGRAAVLYAQWIDLGVECPGVVLTNLKALENSFGMSYEARLKMRIKLVDGESPTADVIADGGDTGEDAELIDFAARRAG